MFDLFKRGIINKKSLLILNYSKFSINENQLAILLIIMELSNEEQKNFTPSQIAKYMNLEKDVIEQEISKLLVDGLITIEQNGKKSILDLSPLFNKIIVSLEEQNSGLAKDMKYSFIEQMLRINLTQENIDLIIEYMNKGLSKPKILSIITENNIKTFDELINYLNEYVKKTNKLKITRYNWLND
ncbi:DnaD family protein [Spiroplasma tabanidicola]|uniref:DnaD family protein n=1 Tax=Spiroplasma tabanidicola TaxID=324079 RepID=A0A6I6CC84_9MOLU|nr:DnaD family protein [Spiroplasma tabanidicola]QGS51722.1 DnaD family protein [Spiroplasma tabanidicola]